MVSYSGPGESVGNPIAISGVKTDLQAVDAEYAYLAKRFGRRGTDWKLLLQSLLDSDGKQIDKMDIELSSGECLTIYFDISRCFGVFGEPEVKNQGSGRKK